MREPLAVLAPPHRRRRPAGWFSRSAATAVRAACPATSTPSAMYLNRVHPLLPIWSHRYDHLREVTPADVTAAVAAAYRKPASTRPSPHCVHCFAYCKKTGTIFSDPTAGIRIGPGDR